VLIIGVVIFVGIELLGKQTVIAIYGERYLDAEALMPYLLGGHLFITLSVVVNSLAVVFKQTGGIFAANLAGTIFSLAFGGLLLKEYGTIGAVVGFTVGCALPFLMQVLLLKRVAND